MKHEIVTTQAFPSADSILYDEMARLMAEVDEFGSHFRATFEPTPDQKDLHDYYWNQDDDSLLVVLLSGGTGSAKSYGALSLIMDLISRFPGTRCLTARHTYDELGDAVLATLGTGDAPGLLDKWRFPYHCKKDPPEYTFPNGSKMLLRSERSTMKTSDQGSKASSLGSTAYDIAFLEEADGLSERFFLTVVARMRQGNLPRPIIILVCNPPTEDHWIYRIFWRVGLGKKKTKRFHFTVANNKRNLRPGYEEDLREILAAYPTLYKKFVEGLPGPDAKGRPIFNGLFHKHMHVADAPLKFDKAFPLWRVWDPGWRRPCVLIGQDNPVSQQLSILYVKMGHEQLFNSFISRELQIHHQLFRGARWNDASDIASKQRRSSSPKSDLEILEGHGLTVTTEYSLISYGLNLIEDLLCTTLPARMPDFQGGPAILLDPARANLLIDALDFGYCQEEDPGKNRRDEIRPVKDGFYDHCVDCLRYWLVQVRAPAARKAPRERQRRDWRPLREDGMYESSPVDFSKLGGRSGGRIASYNFGRRKR